MYEEAQEDFFQSTKVIYDHYDSHSIVNAFTHAFFWGVGVTDTGICTHFKQDVWNKS